MKNNPQNIEVGDVVTFRHVTSIVLAVNGNNDSDGDCYITMYLNGESHNVHVQDEPIRIIRKWDGSIPSKQAKQSKVKAELTYQFTKITDKSFETLVLAVKLIEGLTSADIVDVNQDYQFVEVTQNLVDKLCEFVNTKNHIFDPDCDQYIKFDGYDFWNNHERLNLQYFLDDVVDRIIVEELKRRVLANKSN